MWYEHNRNYYRYSNIIHAYNKKHYTWTVTLTAEEGEEGGGGERGEGWTRENGGGGGCEWYEEK